MSDEPEVAIDGNLDDWPLDRVFRTAMEPCESCGQAVAYVDLAPLFEGVVPNIIPPEILGGPGVHEVHKLGERVVFRRHSPARCLRVRAGDPDPLA